MGLSPPLLQININKKAGTGKLYLITILFITLCNMARANSKPLLLAEAAFTGVTAFNINSRTIYNLLRLPVNYTFKELPSITSF